MTAFEVTREDEKHGPYNGRVQGVPIKPDECAACLRLEAVALRACLRRMADEWEPQAERGEWWKGQGRKNPILVEPMTDAERAVMESLS